MSDRAFGSIYIVLMLYFSAGTILFTGALFYSVWWLGLILLPLIGLVYFLLFLAWRAVINTFRYNNIIWDHPKYGGKK